MATFPALEPLTRSYDFGVYPVSDRPAFAGGTVRFRHGIVSSGHTLQLGYSDLTATEGKLIRDHYRAQQGGFLPFALSPEAWAGHSSSTDLVPDTTQWRYVQPPQETHKDAGLMDITVNLVSVI